MNWSLLLLVAGTVAACGVPEQDFESRPADTEAAPRVYALDETPAELAPAVEGADAAIQALGAALIERLTTELNGERGALGAIHVCRDDAQAITGRVAEEQGIEVGRTSHRLRNPANAPRFWLEPFVEEGAGRPFDDMRPRVVDLGERVGLVRPLPTLGMCTTCHGPADDIRPEVRGALADAYPEDRALGFTVGDLRGWIWAEAPKPND